MYKSKGFTLIELVIVIVVLGIVAVTAAPRFLNIQGDARDSTLEGVAAKLETAIELAHSKLVILELENKTVMTFPSSPSMNPEVGEWCEQCYFINGYPGNMDHTFKNLLSGMSIANDKEGHQENMQIGSNGTSDIVFSFKGNFDSTGRLKVDNCYISYTAPTKSTNAYEIEVVSCE